MTSVERYEQETGDIHPTKPVRVWVNTLKGQATKPGLKWIKDQRKWEVRYLRWFKERLEASK